MAERELYEILLKIASEADPSAFNDLKKLADLWKKNGIAIEDINKGLAGIAERKYPDVFGKLEDELAGMADEGERAQGVLGGLLGLLRDMAAVAGGILLRDIIVGGIRRVREVATALKNMAFEFVKSTKDINEQMELYRAQLTALLEGARQSGQALDYIRRMAIVTPFFGVAELAEGIRLLTAFGLNYERWMPVVASTAVATASSIQQIANAFGMIASGATTRGLYYLKIAGINVRDAGIEFDKSGQAISSTQEILEKLEAYLRDRYGDLLPEIAHTWRGSIEAMRDMWYQFRWQLGLPTFEIVREKLAQFQDWLTENQDNILAFAYVLGEYPARALQRFLDFLGEVTGQIDFQAQDFFRGAVNLMVSFADGLLTALDQWVLPAVLGIADLIASFLLGTSPPPRGPLSRVYEGAIAVMKTYLLALKEGVDFRGLREIAGFIQAALTHAVAIGDLPEEQLASFVLRAREMIARAIGEIARIGGVTAPTLADLSAFLGPVFADVQEYLGLLAQLKAASDAVAAAQRRLAEAQEWVAEAAEAVRKAHDRLRRFEIETAEIPERFTRGRRRELELAIQQAEEERRRRQEAVRIAQQQLRAAQEQVRAIKEQISLQRAYMSELERIWRLQQEQAKAQEEGAEAWRDTVPELKKASEELDKLREKYRKWFAEEIDPILRRLEDHWTRLGDFVRGFVGIELPGVEYDIPQIPEAYEEGVRFRLALQTILDNLDKLPQRIREILDEVKEFALLAGGVWLVLKGFQLAEGLVVTVALAKALGFTGALASAVKIVAGGIGLPILLLIGGFALSQVLEKTPLEALLDRLFPGLLKEDYIRGIGEDTGSGFIRGLIEHIKGSSKDTEESADEGFVQPILRKARELWKKLVGRSVFRDIIDDILYLFRWLPYRLRPYLIYLYNTVTTWAEYTADAWVREIEDMTEAADNLVDVLRTLLALLQRLEQIMGGLPSATTRRHRGGPIFRTGQYQLEAGEHVLTQEQAAMAGAGAGFVGGTFKFIHNWPEGIDKIKRRDFQKMAEKAAFEVVDKLMRESGRD